MVKDNYTVEVEADGYEDGIWRVVVVNEVTMGTQSKPTVSRRLTVLPLPFTTKAWAESAARGLLAAYELQQKAVAS